MELQFQTTAPFNLLGNINLSSISSETFNSISTPCSKFRAIIFPHCHIYHAVFPRNSQINTLCATKNKTKNHMVKNSPDRYKHISESEKWKAENCRSLRLAWRQSTKLFFLMFKHIAGVCKYQFEQSWFHLGNIFPVTFLTHRVCCCLLFMTTTC